MRVDPHVLIKGEIRTQTHTQEHHGVKMTAEVTVMDLQVKKRQRWTATHSSSGETRTLPPHP